MISLGDNFSRSWAHDGFPYFEQSLQYVQSIGGNAGQIMGRVLDDMSALNKYNFENTLNTPISASFKTTDEGIYAHNIAHTILKNLNANYKYVKNFSELILFNFILFLLFLLFYFFTFLLFYFFTFLIIITADNNFIIFLS